MHSDVDVDAPRERSDDSPPADRHRPSPRPLAPDAHADHATASATPPTLPADVRRWSRPQAAGLAVGSVALVLGVLTVAMVLSGRRVPSFSEVLHDAAETQRHRPEVVGNGPIRHVRFMNLTDRGAPTYDDYIAPDGTFYDHRHGVLVLEDEPGTSSTAALDTLPTDTDGARSWMRRMAERRGLGFPDEPPERAMYRLSTELLVDPSVTPRQKAAVLDVLADFRNESIRARSRGTATDVRGRRGTLVEFRFEEGYVDEMIIDPDTGTLLSVMTSEADGRTMLDGQVYLRADMTDRAR